MINHWNLGDPVFTRCDDARLRFFRIVEIDGTRHVFPHFQGLNVTTLSPHPESARHSHAGRGSRHHHWSTSPWRVCRKWFAWHSSEPGRLRRIATLGVTSTPKPRNGKSVRIRHWVCHVCQISYFDRHLRDLHVRCQQFDHFEPSKLPRLCHQCQKNISWMKYWWKRFPIWLSSNMFIIPR